MHELNRSEFKSRMHVLPILTLTGTNQTATHYRPSCTSANSRFNIHSINVYLILVSNAKLVVEDKIGFRENKS